jgi:uncharacterized protein (UPF0332 family)
MLRAGTACSSARVLLERGDMAGAANRAYYAMFDAARAALLAAGADAGLDAARSHSGLIAAFGSHLVKGGLMTKEMGRILNRAHEMRLAADYRGDALELAEVGAMVEQAATFMAAVDGLLAAMQGPSAKPAAD